MIALIRKAPILLALVALLTVGSSAAIAQAAERKDQREEISFKGIHRNRGINGRRDTVTISDGETYKRVTEQEYRERKYMPELDRLPTLIIQRIPVQQHEQ